jgi:hypothetical protein
VIRSLLKHGYVAVAGDASGEWGRVHIADLVDLLRILLTRLIEDKDTTPFGKYGIIFDSASHNTWLGLAQEIINVGVRVGQDTDQYADQACGIRGSGCYLGAGRNA